MDMSGEQIIPAPRARVWAALNDPAILKQAIPGCEVIDKQSDTELTATVVAKVGPVKATFKGKVTLSDIDPPNGYTITGEGQGGAAGFGKGGAKVALSDAEGGATRLSYTANAQVGGKLAQIGARLVDGAAKKMADDFFANFNRIVGEQEAASAAPVEAAPIEAAAAPVEPQAVAPPPAPAPQGGGVPMWIWVAALIVLALGALWLSQR